MRTTSGIVVFDCFFCFFFKNFIHYSRVIASFSQDNLWRQVPAKIRDSGELKQKVSVENWTSNLMHQNVKAYFKMLMEDSRRTTVLKVSDDAVISHNSEAGTLEGFPGSGYW